MTAHRISKLKKARIVLMVMTAEMTLTDLGFIIEAEGDLFGRGDVKSIIGEDHEILHKGLGESDQPEFFRADHPEQIGQDDDGQNIGDDLQP